MDRYFTQEEAYLYHLAHETILKVLSADYLGLTDEQKLDMVKILSEAAIKDYPDVEAT